MKFKFLIAAVTIFIFLVSCSSTKESNDTNSYDSGNSYESFISDYSCRNDDNESINKTSSCELSDTSFIDDDPSQHNSFVESEDESPSENIDKDDNSSAQNDNSSPVSNDDDFSSEESEFWDEPQGTFITTDSGNTFETNCTDEECLSIMKEIADTASLYNKVSIYYTDVEQNYFFSFGSDLIHNTASTIKAPYATYILKSDVDLNETLVMEERHVQGGSGVLKNMSVGTSFTVKDLIKYMITRSDNTAYEMLLERFGTSGFTQYAKTLGLEFKIPSGGYTTCTIKEMAIFLLDIYKFEGNEKGNLLIEYMKNCSYSLQIPKATSHPVAHKFGFIYEGKAFHDMGIVYAPTPYLELIYTKIDGTVYDTEAFIKIGKLIEQLNNTLSDEY